MLSSAKEQRASIQCLQGLVNDLYSHCYKMVRPLTCAQPRAIPYVQREHLVKAQPCNTGRLVHQTCSLRSLTVSGGLAGE